MTIIAAMARRTTGGGTGGGQAQPPRSEADRRTLAVRDRGRDLALSAGAGSGKTSLLVGRYVSLVTDDGVPPAEILAITFTVLAAAEMRQRVAAELGRMGWEAERRAAERAEITTIHGFCAALIREHFFLAGVDPEFRVPTDVDTDRFLDAAFADHFRGRDPEFFALVARYGEDFVRAAVMALVRQEQSLGYGAERLAGLAADISGERAARRAEADRRRAETSSSAAGALEGLLAERLSGKSAEKLSAARGLLPALRAGACDEATLLAVRESTSRLLKLSPEGRTRRDALKAALEALDGFSEAAWAAELESEPARRALYGVAATTIREHSAFKARRGLVDYEDMLRLARDLLKRHRGVAEALRRRHRHVLVDEFQDTNRLQAEIVELLRTGCPGKLFAVGDVRQSIYRFRHAEVGVFRRHLEQTASSDGAVLELAENYRSRPEVLAFTNALFERLRPGEFRPLTAAARYASRLPLPAVELLVVPQDKLELARARWREADRLAAHVAALIESGAEVHDRETGSGRPIEPRDVAVLCRTRGPFGALERAFAACGVPAEAGGGREFYDRVEITDLITLLGWLADPADDTAAAAVLRSPFFDLSDDGLFWLARAEGGPAAAAEAGRLPAELSAADRAAVELAAGLLAEARAMAGHSSAAAVIEHVAAGTGYFEKILARRRGLPEHANLRRFVAEAGRFAAHSGGLAAAADHFRRSRAIAAAAADGESAAAFEPGRAVSILTVHAAKGLEFPVVAVADLGREIRGGGARGPALDADLGLGLKLADEFGERSDTAGSRLVELRTAGADAAEEDRLLYVAMTRARERLILSGVSKLDEPSLGSGRHIDRIRAALGTEFQVAGSESRVQEPGTRNPEPATAFAGVAIGLPDASAARPGRGLVTLAGKLGAGFAPEAAARPPEGLEPTAADLAAADGAVRRLAAPALEAGGALEARVTELAEMDGCPRRHVLERLAALDGARAAPAADAAEPGEHHASPGGAKLGTEVHELLERMDFAGAGSGSKVQGARSEGSQPATRDPRPATGNEATKLVARFLKSDTAGRLARAQREGRLLRETELHLRIGGALVSGEADALVLEGGSPAAPERVLVLDYKTDRDAGTDLARATRRHELQVRLYALAARRAWPGAAVEAAIAFLAAGKVASVAAGDAELAAAERRAGELLAMLGGGGLEERRWELCTGCPEPIKSGCRPGGG